MSRRALFLDRDGVINFDYGYVFRRQEFVFVDGIFELVRAAHESGILNIVVTNQAGIGRGYYSESDFHDLMSWVREEFLLRGGAIDAVYFCPYHPEHGVGIYRRESDWRKPAPGMLLQAAKDLDIDMTSSIMIGDKLSDMDAASAAGVGTLLHLTGPKEHTIYQRITTLQDALPYLRPQN